ncbi:MAG TPA: hypothetical protein VNW51_10350 [Mucilaginibacter sp.]|nr:hypothetical protein [Mucilaginibacter sp.]
MKKIAFIFCLLIPLLGEAQNVKTLKHQADSLRQTGNYQKAEPLYTEAINRVTSYEEKVTNHQWVELCIAAQQNHIKAYSYTDDKAAAYVNWEYGQNGPILKSKINELIKQKAKLVFTYEASGGFAADTYMFGDSISHTRIGFTPAARKILFWATADDIFFMQAFSDVNIYEPLKLENKAYINFAKSHQDELPFQTITRVHLKNPESPFYVFRFYAADNVWVKEISDPYNTVDPTVSSNTALCKLLPIVKDIVKGYDAW